MPAADLQAYKVASNESSSSTKFDNFVQACQDAINAIDDSKVSSNAAIAVSKLAAGSNTNVLTTTAGVPVWAAPAAGIPTPATTLPGSPTAGQLAILVDSTSAPTWSWLLIYNGTTTKWHYLGGTPGFHEIATAESTSSTTYVALATAGPLFALPVAGDYDVEIGSKFIVNNTINMSYDIGGTGAVDADRLTANNNTGQHSRVRRKTGLTAVTLTAKYKVDTGTHTAENRWMRVTPVKIG
jgi:hypothetical protein